MKKTRTPDDWATDIAIFLVNALCVVLIPLPLLALLHMLTGWPK